MLSKPPHVNQTLPKYREESGLVDGTEPFYQVGSSGYSTVRCNNIKWYSTSPACLSACLRVCVRVCHALSRMPARAHTRTWWTKTYVCIFLFKDADFTYLYLALSRSSYWYVMFFVKYMQNTCIWRI